MNRQTLPASQNPDAVLIALCEAVIQVEQADRAGWAAADTQAEQQAIVVDRTATDWLHTQHQLIRDMPAYTLAGARIKARVALQFVQRNADETPITDEDGWGPDIAWALVADLAGGAHYLEGGAS